MTISALDFMASISSRFVKELLPVTLASVIGAMLVNHYGREPAPAPIVIQAPASASEDAMMQSLREERQLIASFVKRDRERQGEAGRSDSGVTPASSAGVTAFSLANPPLPEPRPVAQKTLARFALRSEPRRKLAPAETLADREAFPPLASVGPPSSAPLSPPAAIEPAPRTQALIHVAGAFSEWVADVAQAPTRVALSHWPDWSSVSPLVRPLALFRED